jgi:hypothetical protein
MRPGTSLVQLDVLNRPDFTDAVTVDFSSGRTSILTVVTSGSSFARGDDADNDYQQQNRRAPTHR